MGHFADSSLPRFARVRFFLWNKQKVTSFEAGLEAGMQLPASGCGGLWSLLLSGFARLGNCRPLNGKPDE